MNVFGDYVCSLKRTPNDMGMPLPADPCDDVAVASIAAFVSVSGRARGRKRRFAWQSSSSDETEVRNCEASSFSTSRSRSRSGVLRNDVADDECGSQRPQSSIKVDGTVEIMQLTVSASSGDFFQLRERSVAEASSSIAYAGPRPPPLGAAALGRRCARLQALLRGHKDGSAESLKTEATSTSVEWPSEALAEAASQLRCHGFVVAEGFLGSERAIVVREAVTRITTWRPGVLGAGRLGAASSATLRGDSVAWPEIKLEVGRKNAHDASAPAALERWLEDLDSLVVSMCPLLPRPSELGSITAREPPMASRYPPGARYIRHYDNNCDSGEGDCNGRRLTAVYYLNEGMTHADGGHLRLVARCGRAYDVLPSLDTLVLFWADRRTPHEVLPNSSCRERFALSCWYIDRAEAPEAPEAELWQGCGIHAEGTTLSSG